MYRTDEIQEGFHTKGYIFKNQELYRIIVGSSNLTLSALTRNREWNTKLVSTDQGEYAEELMTEFTDLWNSQYAAAFEDFIDEYALKYRVLQKQREIAKREQIPSLEQYKLHPNTMQLGFIANLQKISASGENKALLISANEQRKYCFLCIESRFQNRRLPVIRRCSEIPALLDCFQVIQKYLMRIICLQLCR